MDLVICQVDFSQGYEIHAGQTSGSDHWLELRREGEKSTRVMDGAATADGTVWDALTMVGGGTMHPPSREMVDKKLYAVQMQGNRVFKMAVPAMEEVAWWVLTDAGLTPQDVDLLIPHQANLRIMDAVAQRLGIEKEKVVVNVDRYGNTSTATIPVALAEVNREGRLKKGDVVLMVSFGGGFTWGGALMTW